MKLLEVEDLTLSRTVIGEGNATHRNQIDDVSFSIEYGQSVALVSEDSESLRTLALTILGCARAESGSVRFEGIQTIHIKKKENRDRWRRLQAVFSTSTGQIPEHLTVKQIFEEVRQVWYRRHLEIEFRELSERIISDCRLSEDVQPIYPNELSAGERQKVALARALLPQPSLLVCQGVTEGLDALQSAELVGCLHSIRDSYPLSLLVLTEDLAVAASLGDAIGVIHQGRLVEFGLQSEILSAPEHEFSKRLVSSFS